MRNIIGFVSTAGALILAATPLAAIGGVAAYAQEADAVRIRTADLDFARPDAQAVFDRRVAAASDALCRPTGPVELARVAECDRTVRAEALAQLRQMRVASVRAPTWVVAGR